MPIFSELYQKKEFNKIKDTKNKLNNLFLIIGILISFFFFFFSKEITFILF
jgi:peptidoglycan biosynthesis protein MviN/MurJ (putative lipid II flippase)